jgi:hypothetical protein
VGFLVTQVLASSTLGGDGPCRLLPCKGGHRGDEVPYDPTQRVEKGGLINVGDYHIFATTFFHFVDIVVGNVAIHLTFERRGCRGLAHHPERPY